MKQYTQAATLTSLLVGSHGDDAALAEGRHEVLDEGAVAEGGEGGGIGRHDNGFGYYLATEVVGGGQGAQAVDEAEGQLEGDQALG